MTPQSPAPQNFGERVSEFMTRHGLNPYQTVLGVLLRLGWVSISFFSTLISLLIFLLILSRYWDYADLFLNKGFFQILFFAFCIIQINKVMNQILLHREKMYQILKVHALALALVFSVFYLPKITSHLGEVQGGMQAEYPESQYENCDRWTQKLSGGIHSFKGHAFYIQICAKRFVWDRLGSIQLGSAIARHILRIAVFDEDGQNDLPPFGVPHESRVHGLNTTAFFG